MKGITRALLFDSLSSCKVGVNKYPCPVDRLVPAVVPCMVPGTWEVRRKGEATIFTMLFVESFTFSEILFIYLFFGGISCLLNRHFTT
jgi:hypothetical protein